MDQNGRPTVQVVINGHSQMQRPQNNMEFQNQPRPLSVDEALQYSSMSSAPVFGLDCVVRPDVGRASNTASINHVLQEGRRTLSELDAEIQQGGQNESSRLETSREYIQQLLDGDQLTRFKFKLPQFPVRSQQLSKDESQDNSSGRDNLGSFARMMLDSTEIAFGYPEASSNFKALETPIPQTPNQRAHLLNKSKLTSFSNTPTPSQLSVVIPVKPLPSPIYHVNPQKGDDAMAVRLKDQKAEADAALQKLQDLLHEVFEAEDQIEPDGSNPPTDTQNPIFVSPQSLEVHRLVLSADAHIRLQKALRKVAGFDRLQDIPSDYLSRIQKLCEKPIIAASSLGLALGDSTSSNELESQEWLGKVEDVSIALVAISTLLQTMSGRQTERELCPEDLIEAIPTVLNQVFDHCIIPAVESRPGGKDGQHFQFLSTQKRIIGSLVHQSKKAISLLADFLARIDVSEGTITATEFFAAKLIFVENAHHDKDSTLGHQKYEPARRGAMDVLAKIFSKYPDQRPFILDEILVSLEKLPTTRQNARQFKVADGRNIQLLTALVLQLVQTTALETQSRSKAKRQVKAQVDDDDDDELMGDGKHDDDESDEETEASLERLASKANRLYDNAMRSAQYIINFIVQRAMNSTKTGDQPYRNILDLFTQDLINVLGLADWPAAELLLRILALRMIQITDQDKSAAIAKSMALELLGWMGSAISDLIATAQHMLPALEDSSDSELTDYLKQQFEEFSSGALHQQDLVAPTGPHRIALEHLLQDKKNGDNWQLASARGYYLAQWAKTTSALYYNSEDSEEIVHDDTTDELVVFLTKSLSDPRWLETHQEFDSVPHVHGKFAYILTVLNSNFGKAFDAILKVLLASFLGDSAKVRSRSLKSVIYMLEKDPNLLDRDPSVLRVIHRCTTDASPMVRDSALQLIGQCIGFKPKLEEEGCRSILTCAADQTAGVRKRCIALLKDIYHKTLRKELKLAILDSFLQRTGDHEESVAALARQTFEEIWLIPFHNSIDSTSDPKLKMALGEQVNLIVGLAERSETALDSLSICLSAVLSDKSKSAASNFKVCKAMVATMFQRLVEDSDGSRKEFQQALLQTITVFAKANAKLFSPDQLEALHPYIGNLSTADDLFIFRSVVVIYRCVLPHLSTSHNTLLKEVQNDLFKSVAKLSRHELNEVMACLWTINGVLQNTNRLVKLSVSVLKPLQQYKGMDLSSDAHAAHLARAKSYIRIAGCVGRHCDLEKYASHFKSEFQTTWSGGSSGSVATLMVDSIIPFTGPNQPFDLRVMALESLGSICQSWPGQFGRERTRQTFAQTFKEDAPALQNIVLRSFADFFAIHEGKSEKAVMPTADAAAQEDTTRLGGSLRASDNDGAAALIAQHFLSNMLQVAQSRQDTYALTAIELVASINRQGLVHPKECAGALVSLETSTVPAIAKVAFDTHKMLHQQYESMFEREYMRAVQEAFCYQRDIVGDSQGATARPYVSKLAPLFDIVKISNSRYQKKFLSNLCSKVNFELKKLDTTGNPPEHLLFSRFISQNLAYFDYGQLAELLPTIACVERIVSATGTIVAHAIETDISPTPIGVPQFDPSSNMIPGYAPEMPPAMIPQQANPATLRLLATAAASLSMLWEARTHLRRLYGVNSHTKTKEGKPVAKDLNKAATKVHGVTGDKFWEVIARNMSALDSEEAMHQKCREFATLLSIDEEFKVDPDEDAEGDSLDAAADVDEMVAPRNMKRKSSVSSSNHNKRSKSRKSSSGKKKSSAEPDDELDWD
ncbi:Armadillo-like helical [Penicillium brevicompactum]|uniref:Sister chromatid cohesion protein n=1 Tax=Penicillium brevicompactum TaxID=5074 RepID=A0A9W9QX12_PENBR|nr:Armadillo-like helical [Penicillium brevicompactum]